MKKLFLSGLVAGLAMSLVGTVGNMLWQVVLPGLAAQYQTPLFRPWSDPLMSLIFVVPVLSGFVMAAIWRFHKVALHTTWWKFAGALSIFSVLGMLMTYSCFPMSFLMLFTWCVSMVIEYLVGAWILAKMIK